MKPTPKLTNPKSCRCKSIHLRISQFPLVDYNYKSNDGVPLGHAPSERNAGNRFTPRSVREISSKLSESEKRWSFVTELFLFGVIVAISAWSAFPLTEALSALVK
jgi:hypothetical protein